MQINQNLINLYNSNKNIFDGFDKLKLINDPYFIIATPRSGSSLLFEQLTTLDDTWSIGGESHIIFKQFPHLQFENENLDSACLTELHADSQTSFYFKFALYYLLKNNKNISVLNANKNTLNSGIFIEKTPRNALNIPFLKAIFPKAKFIYLYREPKQNIASIIEAWDLGLKTNRFVTFFDLPNWNLKKWCLLLPRNWRSLNGKSIAEIAFFQWKESNKEIINNLKKFQPNDWISLDYNSFITNPNQSITKLTKFISHDITHEDGQFTSLPLSKTVVEKPSKNKWEKHKVAMQPFIQDMEEEYKRIQAFCKNN
jgi:hypothetical protein